MAQLPEKGPLSIPRIRYAPRFCFAPRLHAAIRASQLALAFVLLITFFWPLAPAFAARLGGAYYVDDAEIGKVGSCEIESWSSFAANGDRISVFSPACVFNLGRWSSELIW